jgi:hypothetical protein
MRIRWLGLTFLLCAACGDDADGPNGAGGPDGGQPMGGNGGDGPFGGMGGAGGSAASSGGTVASGGSSDTGGAGGSPAGTGGSSMFDPAEHCAPGEYFGYGELHASRAFGGLAINCYGDALAQAIDNGLGEGVSSLVSIQLPEPLTQSTGASVSMEIESRQGGPTSVQVEFWAAHADCGSSGTIKQFHAEPVDSTRVYCGSITPDTAYTHILQVFRRIPDSELGGIVQRGTTLCAAGYCPTR